jgi:hypothetical protein
MTEQTKGERVLIVEDNPAYLEAALASWSIPRFTAVDLDSAMEILKPGSNLSGVITDCFFPEKTGSGKRDLGRQVIQKIAGHYTRPAEAARETIDEIARYVDIDDELRGQIIGFVQLNKSTNFRQDPLLKSIAKLGNVLPRSRATHIIRNAFRMIYGNNGSLGRQLGNVRDFYGDMMSALERDEHNQPLGILVAERARDLGLPRVIATSTYHHDSLTQPVQDYCGKIPCQLIDCAKDQPEQKATPEFWIRAFESLGRSR